MPGPAQPGPFGGGPAVWWGRWAGALAGAWQRPGTGLGAVGDTGRCRTLSPPSRALLEKGGFNRPVFQDSGSKKHRANIKYLEKLRE